MIYIYYHTDIYIYIAKELQRATNGILTRDIINNNNDILFIMLGSHLLNYSEMPAKYIVYQLEQSTWQNNYFDENYKMILNGAIEVWDYSLINYRNMKYKDFKYVPLYFLESATRSLQFREEKDIDILFYGTKSIRRERIYNKLKNLLGHKYNIVFMYSFSAQEKIDFLSRTKVVINIHYNELNESILEIERLSYLLSNNKYVLTERSIDPILDREYSPYVRFLNVDDDNDIISNCELAIHEHKVDTFSFLEKKTIFPLDNEEIQKAIKKEPQNSNQEPQNSNQEPQNSNQEPQEPQEPYIAKTEIKDGNLHLKLNPISDIDLPYVSIVTITYNRKNIFPIAIRNFSRTYYPKEKLEWIIIDDTPNETLLDILPNDSRIKYFNVCNKSKRLSIGEKRNIGVKNSSYDYICFMDDDDYYYDIHVYSRILTLLNYPQHMLCGVLELIIYDIVNEFTAKVSSENKIISEASMAFRKEFWTLRPFENDFTKVSEGHLFLKNRYGKAVIIPSPYVLIAITHNKNYTQSARSYDSFNHIKKSNDILKLISKEDNDFLHKIYNSL